MKVTKTVTVDDEVYKKFKKRCKDEGYTISSRINVLLKKDNGD